MNSSNWSAWPAYIRRKLALRKSIFDNPTSVLSPAAKDCDAPNADDVVGWVYFVLTTLDAKASALMRLNGVLIAAAAFLLGLFGRQGGSILSTTRVDAAVIIFCALLSAVSISACLLVVNVSWAFLGKAVENATAQTFDFADEVASLDKAATFRQGAYRGAWWISLIASIGFLFEFLRQTLHVLAFCFAGGTP